MLHSIIIAHRNRNAHLEECCASIRASAAVTGQKYEIIVADNGSATIPAGAIDREIIIDRSPMELFNKPRLLNLGIAAAGGDILSFLDADAIVGAKWLWGARAARRRHLTMVCYRVRYLTPAEPVDWSLYEKKWKGYEAYNTPTYNPVEPPARRPGLWVFGNSQFTIARDKLADLRFDEGYAGRGCEDLDMMFQVWIRHKPEYRAMIWTKAPFAILCRRHEYEEGWKDRNASARNWALFINKWRSYG